MAQRHAPGQCRLRFEGAPLSLTVYADGAKWLPERPNEHFHRGPGSSLRCLIVSAPRQFMIGSALCGSRLTPQAPHFVCPSSHHNGRQKNRGSEGRKSWEMSSGGRLALVQ